jgi:hypothetical protein
MKGKGGVRPMCLAGKSRNLVDIQATDRTEGLNPARGWGKKPCWIQFSGLVLRQKGGLYFL